MSQNPETPKPNENRKALGRGLAALLGDQGKPSVEQKASAPQVRAEQSGSRASEVVRSEKSSETGDLSRGFLEIEISKVFPNPDQPRKNFNQAQIDELADSIREHGLIQPIVVRPSGPNGFVIVAGERRWRAAKKIGLHKIPVVLKDQAFGQLQNDLVALIENIQREDLNAIELAQAYDQILKKHGYSQEQLAQKLGLSRVAVANTLRLLKLPGSVREMVVSKVLSEGHSRALLGLVTEAEIEILAKEIVEKSLSVRDVENRVRMSSVRAKTQANNVESANVSGGALPKLNEISSIEDELRLLLGTKVSLRGNLNRGSLEVYFSGRDSLNRVLHLLRSAGSGN
jgi:ParB family chromosome partitioning protein